VWFKRRAASNELRSPGYRQEFRFPNGLFWLKHIAYNNFLVSPLAMSQSTANLCIFFAGCKVTLCHHSTGLLIIIVYFILTQVDAVQYGSLSATFQILIQMHMSRQYRELSGTLLSSNEIHNGRPTYCKISHANLQYFQLF